jgi:hypothetical protein
MSIQSIGIVLHPTTGIAQPVLNVLLNNISTLFGETQLTRWVWYSVLWYGMVWYGMVCCDVVCYAMVCCDVVWYGMVVLDDVWYGVVWYVPYGIQWYSGENGIMVVWYWYYMVYGILI